MTRKQTEASLLASKALHKHGTEAHPDFLLSSSKHSQHNSFSGINTKVRKDFVSFMCMCLIEFMCTMYVQVPTKVGRVLDPLELELCVLGNKTRPSVTCR